MEAKNFSRPIGGSLDPGFLEPWTENKNTKAKACVLAGGEWVSYKYEYFQLCTAYDIKFQKVNHDVNHSL